jgi:hypothetical protein
MNLKRAPTAASHPLKGARQVEGIFAVQDGVPHDGNDSREPTLTQGAHPPTPTPTGESARHEVYDVPVAQRQGEPQTDHRERGGPGEGASTEEEDRETERAG